jgi:hypothetical protein
MSDQNPTPGEKPLNNQQAKAIASEILAEFNAAAVVKIIGNLERQLRNLNKQISVEFQVRQAAGDC